MKISDLSHARRAHVLGRSAQRTTILCLAIVTGLVAAAQAKPRIDVGSHTVGNSPLEIIDVFVTGGDPLQGIDMFVSIADEGNNPPLWVEPSPADPGEPRIVSDDIVTGTVFDGNSTRVAPGVEGIWSSLAYQSDQVWQVLDTTNFGAVPAAGKIFTITLDTRGVAPGTTWPLKVLGVLPN